MTGDISSQESNYVQNRLSQMMDVDKSSQVELNWTQIGSRTLNEYTTKNLMVMCFADLFFNLIGDPTTKVRKRDVTVANSGKHLLKFCVKYHAGKYRYYFSDHERLVGRIKSIIERHRKNHKPITVCS